MSDPSTSRPARLIIPPLSGLYAGLHDLGETLLRIVLGLALVTHGYGKVLDPFGAAGMVEEIGFRPGAFWSPLLSFTEFFAGLFLAFGFLTRPAAVAATIILLVTVYFHWSITGEGYGGAEKSILWAAGCLFFAIRGANRQSVDAVIGRQF